MRILVLSDSHGDTASLRMAIESEKNADAVVFLGDGLSDFDAIKDIIMAKQIIAVAGNCDSRFTPYPDITSDRFGDTLIYCTHGFREGVKTGLDKLKAIARTSECTVALFGHTHTPFTSYDEGLYLMNPGSVRQNSYGIVDITDKGIICFNKKISG